MPLNFTAIDFETANGHSESVCAVGVAKVRDGKLVDSDSWLVKPPAGYDTFNAFNVKLHGVSPERVKDAASWSEVLIELREYFEGDYLVAHNEAFDRGVFVKASAASGLPEPDEAFFCSVKMARRHEKAPSNSLAKLANYLGLPEFAHHQAEADAVTCALVVLELSRRTGLSDLFDLWKEGPKSGKSGIWTFSGN